MSSARVGTIFTGRPWTSILPLSPSTTQNDIHWLVVRGLTSAYRRRRRAERASAHERGEPAFAAEAPGVRPSARIARASPGTAEAQLSTPSAEAPLHPGNRVAG